MSSPSSRSAIPAFIVVGLSLPVILFLATGLFDYLYVRHLVGQFEQGLADVDFANPHLGKALVAGICGFSSFLYLRFSGASPGYIKRIIGFTTTTGFAVAAISHLIAGIGTWNHYFDALGKALLRYEITYDNQAVFYSSRTVSPVTGKPLAEVTPSVVHELETRRRLGGFAEVSEPSSDRWFASGTGEPLLWYSQREDGIHLFNMPGYDRTTSKALLPVTIEVQRRYFDQRRAIEEQAAKKAAEAAAIRKEESLAREQMEREREEKKLVLENAKLKEELEIERQIAMGTIPKAKPVVPRETQKPEAATPEPQTETKTRWSINLLPDIEINLNGVPLDRNSRRPPPLHKRCGSNHHFGDICPATGLRYTN